MNRPTTYK